jgi:hypothetical protein
MMARKERLRKNILKFLVKQKMLKITSIVQDDANNKKGKKLCYSFYLFVNPISGGKKASVFTKLDVGKELYQSCLKY